MAENRTSAEALHLDLESLIRRGLIREAIRRAREELSAAQRSGNVGAQGRCHSALNLAYQYLGQHRESLVAAQRAIDCYEAAGNELGLGIVLTRAAVDLAQLGDAAEAMTLITRALKISRRMDDPALSFRLWNNLAHAERMLNHYPEALAAIAYAIEVAERIGDNQAQGHARSNAVAYRLDYAAALLQNRSFATAHHELANGLVALDEMLAQCERFEWPHLVPDMARSAGRALHAADRGVEARRILQLGVEVARRLERRGDLVDLLLDLVGHERQSGDTDAARRALCEAETLLPTVDSDQAAITFHLESSHLCRDRGEFAEALRHFETYHELMMARTQRLTDTRAQVMAIRFGNERALADAEMMRQRAQRLEGDIQHLNDERARLSTIARQDELTGVGNRRAFDEHYRALGREELNRAAVLLLDLDHFKVVNDTFGHATGDEVLTRVGAVLTGVCRPRDVVCRFGGEEFIVLALGVDPAEAESVAERMRREVAEHAWHELHPGLAVTASIGVAMCRGRSRDRVVRDADRALYSAKDLGRDRVVSERTRLGPTLTLPRTGEPVDLPDLKPVVPTAAG